MKPSPDFAPKRTLPMLAGLAVAAWLALCPALSPAADAESEEENFRYQTVKTKEGLTFRVPEDMPIENRGGILAPIPFDEYMYGKFKQMDLRLQRIEKHLEKIEALIERSSASTVREPLASK